MQFYNTQIINLIEQTNRVQYEYLYICIIYKNLNNFVPTYITYK